MDKAKLRSGYTTGACAAAAAKGALLGLLTKQPLRHVSIRLPMGQLVTFPLHTSEEGRASVVKDAGDDPDVTDKAEICATVSWSDKAGVSFLRGKGVGLVTKNGLPVPPGEPAINPAPRKLIEETLMEVLEEFEPPKPGLAVEISVPGGQELAKKTFNPRLGIIGGISILGTTGIVVPYSTSAWLASVVQGIDVASAQGITHLVLTVGERGERLAKELLHLPEDVFVQIGPFFGEGLRHCGKAGTQKVTLVAMIGKLAKFAAGQESVHSTAAQQDFAFLARIAQVAGASEETIGKIKSANTAQEVAEWISVNGPMRFFDMLCHDAWNFGRSLIPSAMELEIILTANNGQVLARVGSPKR
jgi:cobalt-precorrin-5B (C1)-methyltransferase